MSAALWSALDVFLRQGLQFLTMIVLARLLTPTDFGVVAFLYIFTGLGATLTDAGLSTALIQKRSTTKVEESTVFWVNVLIGIIVAALIILLAENIAALATRPELVTLLSFAGLSILASSFGVVPQSLLTKRLEFRPQMICGASAALVSGCLSITCAINGFGIWALAVQLLSMPVCFSVFLWVFSGWRPRLAFSATALLGLSRFGGYVLIANLIDVAYSRAYTLLIGRFIGFAELGFYDRAEQTKQLPATVMAGVMGRVLLPLYSESSMSAEDLRHEMRVSIRGLMLINLPLMLLLAALAESFILTLYGEKWLGVVEPFRILCLAAALWPLHIVNVNALLARGHSKLVFNIEVPKKIVGLLMLFVGLSFGLNGVAWSQVAFSLFAFLINALVSGRVFRYGISTQLLDVVGPLALSMILATLAFAISSYLDLYLILELLLISVFSIVAYVVAGLVLKIQAFTDLREVIFRITTRATMHEHDIGG